MRLLFVTDGRSPISRNWIRYFVERGDEVFLASTFACDLDFAAHGMEFIPVAFSGTRKPGTHWGFSPRRRHGWIVSQQVELRTRLRQWFGPLTIPLAARKLRAYLKKVEPDLVHAMRIPYEGMLASAASDGFRLIVSVWGNDFTLHASSTPLMKVYTRRVLRTADALHTDCERDLNLARRWGFPQDQPAILAPGNGGIRRESFHPPIKPVDEPVVIQPRGIRAYVRNESFFQAIPLVLARKPEARFLCASMAEQPAAVKWVKELHIERAVDLLPALPHAAIGNWFRKAQISVSPEVHDGTPNSLLEGMACGCFPIAGDIESIREWIVHGQNGLLVDPNDPQSLAEAMLLAMERSDLRRDAAGLNANLIATRAEYRQTMARVSDFYQDVVK